MEPAVSCTALLPESPYNLIMQWLHQIGKHSPLTGLDEGLDRHAWQQLESGDPSDFLRIRRYACDVIARSSALIMADVSRHHAHRASDFGCRPGVES
jgi:hypothetical protein